MTEPEDFDANRLCQLVDEIEAKEHICLKEGDDPKILHASVEFAIRLGVINTMDRH